ncbi:IclR family transcriptional regulator [Geobacillus sp. C56-T3]|uniref:IclR family transcriptional regulator n=1 Tax=Geobacillus sp. (strain C56-T3) TaxID=691437 RepID=UPI0001D58838|nr:IclR family transcriptional regulator [Geobacillus sp. C56-T3]ADI26553.1 transcriptional regulator, IclR family [Geobacillus sp. C56-T3]
MPLIQAVDRALRILDLFDEYETELKITDISERMQLHKSTVHSLLKTLQHHHYIEQNPENGKYRLGMKLFERGNLVIRHLDIRSVSKKHLIDLSIKTGNTVHLVILDGKEGIYIDKVEGTSGTVLYSRIGRRVPIHSSAVGKALVAFKSEKELKELLRGYVYKRHTANTIANEEEFLQELERVRSNGYALDREENEPGITCVAVPVRDHSGNVIAAISISQPSAKVDDLVLNTEIRLLQSAAEQISREMGYVQHGHLSV